MKATLTKPSQKFYVPDSPLMASVAEAMHKLTPNARDFFVATELCGALQIFSWIERDEVFTVMSLLAPSQRVLKGLLEYRLEYLRTFSNHTTISRLMISLEHNPLTFEAIKSAQPSADETLIDSTGKLYISFTLNNKPWFYLMPHPFAVNSDSPQ